MPDAAIVVRTVGDVVADKAGRNVGRKRPDDGRQVNRGVPDAGIGPVDDADDTFAIGQNRVKFEVSVCDCWDKLPELFVLDCCVPTVEQCTRDLRCLVSSVDRSGGLAHSIQRGLGRNSIALDNRRRQGVQRRECQCQRWEQRANVAKLRERLALRFFGDNDSALVEHSRSEGVRHVKTKAFPNPGTEELPHAVFSVLSLRCFSVEWRCDGNDGALGCAARHSIEVCGRRIAVPLDLQTWDFGNGPRR